MRKLSSFMTEEEIAEHKRQQHNRIMRTYYQNHPESFKQNQKKTYEAKRKRLQELEEKLKKIEEITKGIVTFD